MVASIDSPPGLTTATDRHCASTFGFTSSRLGTTAALRGWAHEMTSGQCATLSGECLGCEDCAFVTALLCRVVSGNTYATALMLGHKIGTHCPATDYARPLRSDRHTAKL
jgi:hypothetical protein